MTTFSIQLHQSLDGKSFSTREEADQHNYKLYTNAYDSLFAIMADIEDDDSLTLAMELILKNKEELIKILPLL